MEVSTGGKSDVLVEVVSDTWCRGLLIQTVCVCAVVVVVVCGKVGSSWTSSALPSRYRRSFFSPPGKGNGHLLPM